MENATRVTTLTEFLLARIAEDEETARAATAGPWEAWSGASGGGGEYVTSQTAGYTFGIREGWAGRFDLAARDAAHIARHDPARVLAECEAKRRIVQWHEIHEDCCEQRYGPFEWTAPAEGVVIGSEVGDSVEIGRQAYYGCVTSMMLAAPYADHPDYREEWR